MQGVILTLCGHVFFLWNKVLLDIDRRAAFRRAPCNYFCLVKLNEHCI